MTDPGAAHTGLASNSEFANERAWPGLMSGAFVFVRVERLVIPLRSDTRASGPFHSHIPGVFGTPPATGHAIV
jgi:hypothetical protein